MLGFLSDALTAIGLYQQVRTPSTRERLLSQGSDTFTYTNAAKLTIGSRLTVSIQKEFPKCRYYEPLDSFEVTNNGNSILKFWLNPVESYTIPAYMIKPIARRPITSFILENFGATDFEIGEIIISMRRLPPDIQPTVNVG